MDRRYDTRHIFLAIGACIALISPVFILLMPLAIVNTLYYQRDIWILHAPGENYLAYGFSLFLVVLACALLWLLDIRKASIGLAITCLVASGVVFYYVSLSYVTLSDEEISYRKLFSQEKKTYDWEELDQLLYYEKLPEDKDLSYYEFYFKDGEMLTIKQNKYVKEIQPGLNSQVRFLGIPLIYAEDK